MAELRDGRENLVGFLGMIKIPRERGNYTLTEDMTATRTGVERDTLAEL